MLRYFSITSQAEQQYLSLSAGLPGAGTSLPRSSRWGFSPGSATRGRRSLQGFCSGSHPAASCSASSCGTQGQPQQIWPCTARQVGSDPQATLLHTQHRLCSLHLNQTQGLSMQRSHCHPWGCLCFMALQKKQQL